VKQQHPLKVYDEDGTLLGGYNAGLFVDNRLIIALKAAQTLAEEPVAQLLGYLRASRVEHGLLMNFGAPKFEIKKYALSRIGERSRPGGLIGGTLSLFALGRMRRRSILDPTATEPLHLGRRAQEELAARPHSRPV
jgi:hypothetical protein